jgi:hypothetical protein
LGFAVVGSDLTLCGADAHPCTLNYRALPAKVPVIQVGLTRSGRRGLHQPLSGTYPALAPFTVFGVEEKTTNPARIQPIILVLLMAVSLLAACTPVSMTVKFTENGCTYDGPESITYGKFTVNWIVEDRKHSKAALAIVTLASGKTIGDLQACPCTEKPDWINALWLNDENAFGPELEKARSYVHEYDLRSNASYHGGSLYMFCGNEEGKTVALGPVEVRK